MYFPYLRGRQYELIALRDLSAKNLLGDKIIPIIEPVKFSSSLQNTIKTFINNNHQLGIILNPSVGSFFDELKITKKENGDDYFKLIAAKQVIKCHIMNSKSEQQLLRWNERGYEKKDSLVIINNRDYLEEYVRLFSGISPRFVLIPNETIFKRNVISHKILLKDNFEKQDRNADYKKADDGFFSADHLYFRDDGFDGFSDYSVIGDVYDESGFAPYAVAIHIVYFTDSKELRIKHFVSDTNDDISNPAKKFYEAVAKLNTWLQHSNVFRTVGLSELIKHYNSQTYPGLGSVKKYTIMHHLEMINNFLTE